MLFKVFEKIIAHDKEEHSQKISNLSDEEFRTYLDGLQQLAEEHLEREEAKNEQEGPQLEELFEQIETIADELEGSDLSLEESFALYDQGLRLLKQSHEAIDEIEKKVMVIDSKGETREF